MLGSFLAYLFRRMLAVNLSVSEYGLIYAMIGFFSFFMLFIDFGLEQAATKYIVEYRVKNDGDSIRSLAFSVLGFQILCSCFLFVSVFLFSNYIAEFYFHAPAAAEYLIILGIWFCTTPLITFISYLLLGFEKTTWYTAVDFFRMVILLSGAFLLLYWNKGIYAPLIMYAFVNIILCCIYIPYIISFFPNILKKTHFFSWTEFSKVFSYGILIALTSFGWMIITQTDMLMLTYFTTTHDVGLYAVALPISLLLLFFMRPINIVFAPLIAKYSAEKKEKELTETISTAYKYAFVLLVPIVLCFTLFPELIISLLFSNEYISAVRALQILAVGTLFYSFSLFNSIIFNSLGKAKVMAVVVALISLLNIILNLLLIPTYTITGAAISTSISYILLFIISTTYISKEISLTFPVQQWMKALLSGAVTIMVIIIIKRNLAWNNIWEAVVCGSMLFVLYVILVVGLRAINLAEIRKCISSVIQ
jgi:O-antigen/teichoic acid export membrane protein